MVGEAHTGSVIASMHLARENAALLQPLEDLLTCVPSFHLMGSFFFFFFSLASQHLNFKLIGRRFYFLIFDSTGSMATAMEAREIPKRDLFIL